MSPTTFCCFLPIFFTAKDEAVDIGQHLAACECALDELVYMLGSSSNVYINNEKKITQRKLLIIQESNEIHEILKYTVK